MLLKNCDMRTFSERVKGKGIVCYGIGDEFHNMINNYIDYPWCAQIRYLVDGNKNKFGYREYVGDRCLKVMSLEAFLSDISEDIVIIVSSGFFKEIVERLNLIDKLDKIECYIYYFMLGLSEHNDIEIMQTNRPWIPSKIHYCWFGGKELPDFYKRCIDSWYKFCPDYEIVRWDENNCDINETLFTRQAYQVGKYGFVPDYFRLKIIYEQGGIYLDTDVELLKNLDDLRYNQAFCGMEVPGRVALGLGFGAAKGNKIIKYMLERYKSMQFVYDNGELCEIASPVWQTKDLRELGMEYGNRIHKVEGMTIYPVEVLSPKNIVTGEMDITEYSYSIHHFDGSWLTGKNLGKKRERENDVAWIHDLMK